MKRIFKNRMFTSVLLSVVLTFMFVFAVAYSSTTISTDITTGTITSATGITVTTGGVTITAGDLTITAGNLVVPTLSTGLIPFVGAAGVLASNANFTWTNASTLFTAKFASSTAMSATNIEAATSLAVTAGGKIGVGTSTPVGEISVTSTSATTTLYLDSTAAGKGGCIELKGVDGLTYRMYVMLKGASRLATTTANSGAGFIAVWEPGACIGTQ